MVQRVGSRIAAVTDLKYQWEFKLIADDKQANAFALPGGKVAVYTGILPITRDEAGLAAVLGHEIGHVLARHGGERLSQQMGVQSATQVLAGLASSNPATVQLVSAALGAGAQVGVLLPWSRQQESEADHLGLILMAKAGYDPHAALELWKRMAEAAKGQRPSRVAVDAPLRRDPHRADPGLAARGPDVLPSRPSRARPPPAGPSVYLL